MNLIKTSFLFKIILLSAFFISNLTTISNGNEQKKIYADKWVSLCKKDLEKNCLIAIKSTIKDPSNNKYKTIAHAYIELASKIQKQMNLIDAEEQTFKLGEKRTVIPVLFIDLPLNLDLRIKPIILIDNKEISQLEYITCHGQVGCKSIGLLNEKQIDLLSKGKNLDVFVVPFGNQKTQGFKVNFSLRGFTKSFNQLASLNK